jgi:hypothetical protein
MNATAINNAITVITYGILPCGARYVVTPCDGYEGFDKLPKGISFDGTTYGLAGWDSDRNTACFRTDATIAYAK